MPLRVGYRFDDGTKTHSVSGGLGLHRHPLELRGGRATRLVSDHPTTMVGRELRFFYTSETAGEPSIRRIDASEGLAHFGPRAVPEEADAEVVGRVANGEDGRDRRRSRGRRGGPWHR